MVTDDVFAVIAEATRRDILVSLRSGDKAVGELVEELEASQPTISKHLKVLREADLVSMRAQGQKRYYALNTKPLENVADWLGTFDVGPAAGDGATSGGNATPKAAARTAAGGSAGSAAGPAEGEHADVEPGAGTRLAAAGGASEAVPEPVPAESVPAGDAGATGALAAAVAPDESMPQQIGRTVGRAATKAADLLANLPKVPNLPKFGRKK